MKLVADYLQISIASSKQPPQESQVAFVQLDLRADLIRKSGNPRSESEVIRDCTCDIRDRLVFIGVSAPDNAGLLQFVFRKCREARRSINLKLRLECRNNAAEYFRRSTFLAAKNRDGVTEFQRGFVLEGKSAPPAGLLATLDIRSSNVLKPSSFSSSPFQGAGRLSVLFPLR